MMLCDQVKVITLCQSRDKDGEDGNKSKHFFRVFSSSLD